MARLPLRLPSLTLWLELGRRARSGKREILSPVARPRIVWGTERWLGAEPIVAEMPCGAEGAA
jgi:hypothetical protein